MATRKGVSVYLDSGKTQAVLGKLNTLETEALPTELKALMAGAQTVVNAAKRAVPKKTRTLQRSIHAEADDESSVVVGTDVSYAKYVEQGTSKMEARPYLRPALNKNATRIQNNVIKAMQQMMNSLG